MSMKILSASIYEDGNRSIDRACEALEMRLKKLRWKVSAAPPVESIGGELIDAEIIRRGPYTFRHVSVLDVCLFPPRKVHRLDTLYGKQVTEQVSKI
jgi:hypothetical protein